MQSRPNSLPRQTTMNCYNKRAISRLNLSGLELKRIRNPGQKETLKGLFP